MPAPGFAVKLGCLTKEQILFGLDEHHAVFTRLNTVAKSRMQADFRGIDPEPAFVSWVAIGQAALIPVKSPELPLLLLSRRRIPGRGSRCGPRHSQRKVQCLP